MNRIPPAAMTPAVALALIAAPAAAHVTVADATAAPGAYHAAFFQLSHGCDGSPTVALRIEIPAEVSIARPQPKPGWSLAVETAPLDQPREVEGVAVHDRVAAVTWRGRLEADQFDRFGIMLRLPDRTGPVYLPAVQTCENGENRWVDIPAAGAAWGSVPHPAPVIEIGAPAAAAPAVDHAHHHGG